MINMVHYLNSFVVVKIQKLAVKQVKIMPLLIPKFDKNSLNAVDKRTILFSRVR